MGKKVVATPSSWTKRGEARCVGGGRRPLLVWQGIVGEEGLMDVLGSGKHQVYGRWLKSQQPSPERVEPPCDRVDLCGGCPWMHLSPSGQERASRELVTQTFAEAGVDVEIGDYNNDGLDDIAGRAHTGSWVVSISQPVGPVITTVWTVWNPTTVWESVGRIDVDGR